MYFSTIAVSTLLASGAFAAPHLRRQQADNQVTVTLSGNGRDSESKFTGVEREEQSLAGDVGPFETINISVGENVDPQGLRCQILDPAGNPIVATRGEATDVTFADGGAGPWRLQNGTDVETIICDPAFQKIGADAFEVRVVLSNQGIELGSQTVFTDVVEPQTKPPTASGPFLTVELRVGALVEQQNLRCQVVDEEGEPIVVLRNGNRDVTFADGDAGLWNFEEESRVSEIICDPEFVLGGGEQGGEDSDDEASSTLDASSTIVASSTREASATLQAEPTRQAGATLQAEPTREAGATLQAEPTREASAVVNAAAPIADASSTLQGASWPSVPTKTPQQSGWAEY